MAARQIGIGRHLEFGNDLFEAYLKERVDKRTWETQMTMIWALGMICHNAIFPHVVDLVRGNLSHDAITGAAAQTYVRIKRGSHQDARPVLELLKFGGLSVVSGALTVLGYDRMVPSRAEVKELIDVCWNLHRLPDFSEQFCDPRYGIAAACAGWELSLSADFLEHCIATAGRDTGLIYVAENSLTGRYVRLR